MDAQGFHSLKRSPSLAGMLPTRCGTSWSPSLGITHSPRLDFSLSPRMGTMLRDDPASISILGWRCVMGLCSKA